MKSITRTCIAIGILILAGCATPDPTPTATPEPSETPEPVLAKSISDIYGTWKLGSGNIGLFFQFNEDGSFRFAQRVLSNIVDSPAMLGEYTLEAGLLSLHTNDESALCTGQLGIYEVHLLEPGFMSLFLKEDPCLMRAGGSYEGFELLPE